MDFNIQKIYNILWHLKCKLLHKNSIKTVWNSKSDLSDFFEVQILIYRCVCWVHDRQDPLKSRPASNLLVFSRFFPYQSSNLQIDSYHKLYVDWQT